MRRAGTGGRTCRGRPALDRLVSEAGGGWPGPGWPASRADRHALAGARPFRAFNTDLDIRPIRRHQDLAHRLIDRGNRRIAERRLRIGGQVAGTGQELVAVPQRQLQRLGQAHDEPAPGRRAASLEEAQVTLSGSRPDRICSVSRDAFYARGEGLPLRRPCTCRPIRYGIDAPEVAMDFRWIGRLH